MKHFLPVRFFHFLVLCLLLCQNSFGADVTLNSFSAYKVVGGNTVTPSSSLYYPLEVVTTGTQIKVDITLERPTGSRAATGIYLIIGGSDISYMVGQNTPFNPTQTTANKSNIVASFNEYAARAYWHIDNTNTSREIQEIGNHPSFLFSLGTSNPNASSPGGYLSSRYLHLVFCDLSTFKVTAVSKAGILLNFVNPPPPAPSPQPVITSISAASGVASDAIKLFGSGFTGITKVWFPTTINRPIPFTVVSDSEIRMNVPLSAAKGLVQIFVNNTSYVSNSIDFTVLQPSTPPTILTFRNDRDQYYRYPVINVVLPGDLIRLFLEPGKPGIWDYDIVAVDFNGVRVQASDLIFYSDYVLRVRVPVGITPGPVTLVTTTAGSSNGVAYRFPRAQSDCGDVICSNQSVIYGSIPAIIRGRLLATGPIGTRNVQSIGTFPWPTDFPAVTDGIAYSEYKMFDGSYFSNKYFNEPIFASDNEEEQVQWQSSYTNYDWDWQDIPNANGRDYQPGHALRTTYYRRASTHTVSGGRREFWYYSNIAIIIPYSPIASGDYLLRNRLTGQVMEIGGGGNTPDAQGARANQWPYLGGSNQQWTIDAFGNGRYRILNKRSNKALEVFGGYFNAGAQINQWDFQINSNQFWLFQPVDPPGNGSPRYYTIVNGNSGQVAEVGGGGPYNTTRGAHINQWPYYGVGTNHQEQEWELVPLPAQPASNAFPGVYTLVNANSNLLLEIGGYQPAPSTPGTVANQWTDSGTDNQHWTFVEVGGGFYKIVNSGSGQVLEVRNGSNTPGTTVNQWPYYGTLAHQEWSISQVSPGLYSIINRYTNQAMQIANASTSGGAQADQGYYQGTSNRNQHWYINFFAQNRPAAPATSATAAPGASTPLELQFIGSPNPFDQQLHLQFALPTTQTYTLAIYDGQGRLVQQLASGEAKAGQAQQITVPTHTYAAGFYLARLTTATGTQLLKLTKQ